MGLGHASALGEAAQPRHAGREGHPVPAAPYPQERTRSEEPAMTDEEIREFLRRNPDVLRDFVQREAMRVRAENLATILRR